MNLPQLIAEIDEKSKEASPLPWKNDNKEYFPRIIDKNGDFTDISNPYTEGGIHPDEPDMLFLVALANAYPTLRAYALAGAKLAEAVAAITQAESDGDMFDIATDGLKAYRDAVGGKL